MTLAEFKKYSEANRQRIQRALYEEADREVNGDPAHYEGLGRLIEEHPICYPVIRGSRAV